MVTKCALLYSGKAKSLYETDDRNLLIAEFRDDATAFNGKKHEKLPDKGKINNQISTFLMRYLTQHNIPTHYQQSLSSTEIVVKRMRMLPLECVIRNVAAGSLCRRLGVEQGTVLAPPIVEFYYKNDALNDPLVNEDHIVSFAWADQKALQQIRVLTHKINSLLCQLFDKANLVLVDTKFEYGIDVTGAVTLGDEISPDSSRIWDKDTQEILDKDRFRQDMGKVVESYLQVADRLGISVN